MLQSISSPRREAASPPSPPQLQSQNAVTLKFLAVTLRTLQLQIPSRLTFKRARLSSMAELLRRFYSRTAREVFHDWGLGVN
jgi:hypothetical protein